jgi:hypothetical protein
MITKTGTSDATAAQSLPVLETIEARHVDALVVDAARVHATPRLRSISLTAFRLPPYRVPLNV